MRITFYGILRVCCRCFSLFICMALVILLVHLPYSVSIFDYFPLLPDTFVEPWVFFGLSICVMVFFGAIVFSIFCNSALNWSYAWLSMTYASSIGGVKFAIRFSVVSLDESLIFMLDFDQLFSLRMVSIVTLQWLDIYVCFSTCHLNVRFSSVKMRSRMLPFWCIGLVTCWFRPNACIVSLKLTVSALDISSVLIMVSIVLISHNYCVG